MAPWNGPNNRKCTIWICQLIIMCEILCWTLSKTHAKDGQRNDKRPFCWGYRKICFTSSLIRQLYYFATDFDRVLLQLLGTNIENTLFTYRVSYRYLTFMIERMKCWWKAVKNLICYSCIFNVQLHVHLKKWTLKFKLLYLRTYISYFNKICWISCVNTHKQNLNSLAQIRTTMAEIQHFFLGDCFLLAHPVDASHSCCSITM